MQKALVVSSQTNLFSHFGGAAAAVSVKMQNGNNRMAKAGQQVEQAGDDPKAEVSSIDEEHDSQVHPAYAQGLQDAMEESYGFAYATRASEMGYGERYGEAVEAIMDKRTEKKQMQRGATSERDQHADAFLDIEYDTRQGEPVAEKEVGRNSAASNAFEAKRTLQEEEITETERCTQGGDHRVILLYNSNPATDRTQQDWFLKCKFVESMYMAKEICPRSNETILLPS